VDGGHRGGPRSGDPSLRSGQALGDPRGTGEGWKDGRLEGGDVWAIHLYALQFSNPVCRLGDAILYQVPGTLIEDFIVAKTAWNALRFPGIRMIH
jgi:hypothetical protein